MPLKNRTIPAAYAATFPPLHLETRPAVSTKQAAHYICRQQQTMRKWATYGGPLKPLRINGRLAWLTDDIRKLLGEGGLK